MGSRTNHGGINEEGVETIVRYIDTHAPDVNPIFGGSSTFDRQSRQYTAVRPDLDLREDLSLFIPETLGPRFQLDWQNADTAKWETLGEDIMNSLNDYEASKNGFWHKIWYGMGDAKGAIDPWIGLIPSEYGLAVVKTGVAVLFKLAEKSKQKKRRICDTFLGLRKILKEYDPSKARFRDDFEVRKHADTLYQAVVDSIRDLIRVITKQERAIEIPMPRVLAKFRKDYKSRPPPPDPERILQLVTDCAGEFQRALVNARDKTSERVDRNVQGVAIRLDKVYSNSKDTEQNTKTIITNLGGVDDKIDKAQGTLTSVESVIIDNSQTLNLIRQDNQKGRAEDRRVRENEWQAREEDRSCMREMERGIRNIEQMAWRASQATAKIAEMERRREPEWQRDQIKSRNDLVEMLVQILRMPKNQDVMNGQLANPEVTVPQAILRPDQFCAILADGHSADEFSKQPNLELSRVLQRRGKVKPQAQSQANSVLRHDSFKSWLNGGQPGLVLVNANLLEGAGSERISAMSVFSGTLVVSLVTAQPDAVVVHFFCGQHASPIDAEFGPNGLLRSIMMQLVLKLVELNRLDLSFVHELQYLDELRSLDPMTRCEALCQALYELVSQFPAGMRIYCILDSISWLDRGETLPMLEVVMDYLREIVEDCEMPPIVKVFMTNAGHATLQLKKLAVFQQQPSRQINLSSRNLMTAEISPRAMGCPSAASGVAAGADTIPRRKPASRSARPCTTEDRRPYAP